MSKKLTLWEVGQDLCFIQDTIQEKLKEIKDAFPECGERLSEISLDVGDLFRDYNDHKFTIRDRKSHD